MLSVVRSLLLAGMCREYVLVTVVNMLEVGSNAVLLELSKLVIRLQGDMTRPSLPCALCMVGRGPVLRVNGGKPAIFYGEAAGSAWSVGGTVHHGARGLHGAGVGGGAGWVGTVHHGAAGHDVIPRLHPKCFRYMPVNMCHRL